ncbi:MAG TPA: helix-turn-helix transcriptional regulator [Planctomycetota bacterium]|nr:helix-turn-helix transcriptional regulator [Planctomycetota bacterium]
MRDRASSSTYLKNLGQAIRAVREQRGASQESLGFDSELDRTYISGVERGVRNPTIASLLRIAKALGTTPAKLLQHAEHVARRS